jgi:hypothetical protein
MQRFAVGLGLCVLLSGCTRFEEAWLPAAAKVNAAFPVPAEVRLAHERLHDLLAADPTALASFKTQYESRMTLRALTCARDKPVGRFDSVASVRALALDTRCFQAQDGDLLQFLGIKTVGVLMAQPPLRLLVPLGSPSVIPTGGLPQTTTGIAAAAAGVAVLRGTRGELTSIEIPGGKQIAALPRLEAAYGEGSVSPNGRIVVVPQGQRTQVFIDTERGTRLWEPQESGRFLGWLPEVAAMLMSRGDGVLMLVDGLSGTLAEHPVGLRQRNWATPIAQAPSRTLVAAARELELLEHTRTPEGLNASLVRQYRLTGGHGITSNPPTSMRDGKAVVFTTVRDLGWLDLESGEQGIWTTTPFIGSGNYAKLDETHLLVDSVGASRVTGKPWSLDVVAGTIAPVDAKGADQGILIELRGRHGFMRRGSQVWLGGEVTVGEAVSLASAVADHNLALQTARLQDQVNAAGAAANGSSFAPAAVPFAANAAPGVANLPADAQVHIVGVYQGGRVAGPMAGGHPLREVRVSVRASARPVVLVLSSYEPVKWIVSNQGARLAAVLLSGYHASTVVGAGAAQVLRIGSVHAYESNNADYMRLRRLVWQYTGGREIRSFQGGYNGNEFSVGP